jgi:hypothetical protein
LLACEDTEGNEAEVVVKLHHANMSGGLAAEAMAALYAFDLARVPQFDQAAKKLSEESGFLTGRVS